MFKKICGLILLVLLVCSVAIVQAAEVPLEQTVSVQEMEQAGLEAIHKRLGNTTDCVITTAYLPNEIKVPAGEISLQGEIPYGIRFNAPTVVNMKISTDGQLYSNVGMRFQVRKYINVLIASRDIAVGEILTADNVRYDRQDSARLVPGYITDIAQLQGFTARRLLTAGIILNNNSIAKPMVIKRGSMITILARQGSLEVTSLGLAMQDAVVGQSIRVQNMSSQKIVTAQVINGNLVQVITYNGR